MADYARFLPLSQRHDADESAVTSDRRAQMAALVDEAARIAQTQSTADPAVERFVATARLTADADTLVECAEKLRAGKSQSIRSCARLARALFALAAEKGAAVQMDAATSGALALYGATSAPLERRAVVAGYTLHATDAEWEFGRGPVLEGRGVDIAAFLLGASEIPPRARA